MEVMASHDKLLSQNILKKYPCIERGCFIAPSKGENENIDCYVHSIIIYNCTSYPFNINTWPPIGMLPIHFKWPPVHWFEVFKVNSKVTSILKSNLRAAYYFKGIYVGWMRGTLMYNNPHSPLCRALGFCILSHISIRYCLVRWKNYYFFGINLLHVIATLVMIHIQSKVEISFGHSKCHNFRAPYTHTYTPTCN